MAVVDDGVALPASEDLLVPRSTAPMRDWPHATVVAWAQAGSGEAYDVLYEGWWPRIFNYLYRLTGDPNKAEDLTQDAMLKAYLNLGRTKPGLRWNAWLYRIATNVFLDSARHEALVKWQAWEAFISVFHPSQVAPDRPDRDAVLVEDREEIRQLLSQLPPKYRLCLELREYADLSYDEIAATLCTTRAAVKSLLFRAREEFRTVYRQEAADPERVMPAFRGR
jgi:RNA polymerase sigma-70 factor, ECF subfamily